MLNYNAELLQHREAHIAYWKCKNVECDMARYDDGFAKGWSDAGHTANWTDQYNMRKEEHIRCSGESDHVWEFEHGYKEAFETYRKGLEAKNKYKEEERETLLVKYREQHRSYHESRGTKVNLDIYDAGWRTGWIDKVEGNYSNERRGNGKDQYVREHGDCEHLSWEYEHGYDEAGRECK